MNGKLHENIRLANLPINGVIQEICETMKDKYRISS